MIRPSTHDDLPSVLGIAVAAGLFPDEAKESVSELFIDSLNGKLGPDHLWLTDVESEPVGVAYYAQEKLTDGTWNLYMIAIRPDMQSRGRGAALLRAVEADAMQRGGRILIVDTSSLPEFDRTRDFYRKNGFHEEARIRDFWKPGDDKIVFWKRLG